MKHMSAEAERKRQKELAEQRGQLKPMSEQLCGFVLHHNTSMLFGQHNI